MTEHAFFSPSAASRWIVCPGSVTVQKEGKASVYAAEGTLMHQISEKLLENSKLDINSFVGLDFEIDGHKVVFTDELKDAVLYYTDCIQKIKDEYPNAVYSIEEKVSYNNLLFGTVDFCANTPFDTLVIVDLKGGKGVSVPADHPQLKLYAIMTAGELLKTYEKIATIVIQPRDREGDTYKTAVFSPSELKNWFSDTVFPAMVSGKSDSPKFQASEDACRWCSASGNCRYQTEAALNIARNEFEPFTEDFSKDEYTKQVKEPLGLTNTELSEILLALPMLENWISAIRHRTLALLLNGEEVPHFMLGEGRSVRQWENEDEIENVLKTEFKLKLKDIFNKKLKSPTQILSILSKAKQEKLHPYIVKPPGKPTIQPEKKEKPKTFKTDSANEDFKGLNNEL